MVSPQRVPIACIVFFSVTWTTSGCVVDHELYAKRYLLLEDKDGDGFHLLNGDCDDHQADIHPDAQEVCNGLDDNCNDLIDEAGTDGPWWFMDTDGDGYGATLPAVRACSVPGAEWKQQQGDCNDFSAAVSPAATERCNGVDDDCDSTIDVNAVDEPLWFRDHDGDGYGDPAISQRGCSPTDLEWTLDNNDCDDTDPGIRPDAEETCNDGHDNNCNHHADQCQWSDRIDLNDALRIVGEVSGERVGEDLAIGDVDGDEIAELIVVSANASRSGEVILFDTPLTRDSLGSVLVEGRAVELLDLDNDNIPEILLGTSADLDGGINRIEMIEIGDEPSTIPLVTNDEPSLFIEHLYGLPDVNRDGVADFVLSAPDADAASGQVYLFSGTTSDATLDDALLTLDGAHSAELGEVVRSADLNGDGNPELLVSAPGWQTYNHLGVHGALFLIEPFLMGQTHVEDIADAMWRGSWSGDGDRAGDVLSTDADLTGDGYADVVVGAWGTGTGRAYILAGAT